MFFLSVYGISDISSIWLTCSHTITWPDPTNINIVDNTHNVATVQYDAINGIISCATDIIYLCEIIRIVWMLQLVSSTAW